MANFNHLRFLSILGIAGSLVMGMALFAGNPARAADDAAVARMAPAWTLKDLGGREVSSAQFKGKVVVVDFWATWCGPCVAEIPGYVELQKKYGPEGLVIVGVSLDRKGPDHVKKFAEANSLNYTIVMGDDTIVEAFGGIDAIPTTFLISRSGRIIHQKTGSAPLNEYEKLVRQALQ